ncbi:MAG: hypothetical protein O2917_10495 [Acidobacteria bacterium]|nr:hypothetical protein [Acidobacteriota bacterium]
MPPEKRLVAATAFWEDEHGLDQQVEVIVTLARKLNFRPKSVQQLSTERRAKLLANMADVSEAVATRGLIGYHLTAERPLMAAFLDAVGLEHDNGLITAEEVETPEPEKVAAGVAAIKAAFPAEAVRLYLHTLLVLDGDTWGAVDGLID